MRPAVLVVFILVVTIDHLVAHDCSCRCVDENRSNNELPHGGGSTLLRGKAGSKGEKGDPGPVGKTPVCDCSMFQSTVDEMRAQLNTLLALNMRNCHQIKQSDPNAQSGIYTIYPSLGNQPFDVKCDMETDGGGWTVFQSRFDGSVDFDRDWDDYVGGFGGLDSDGEFWMGLNKIHQLTSQGPNELRIDLSDFEGGVRFAKYSSFSMSEGDDYTLTVGGYTGDAGDSFSNHNGFKFTTRDRDQDWWEDNCAVTFRGAWWHGSCHTSNLNGLYLRGNTDQFATGMVWKDWKGYHYALRTSKMMMRTIIN